MSIRVYRFETSTDAEHFLNGGISGGAEIVHAGRVLGLHNKTLIFTSPAGTVTFSDPTGAGLSAGDIKSQIEAALATLKVTYHGYKIRIIRATPTAPVVLSNTGTANPIFGFGSAVAATGVVFNPIGGAAPAIMTTEANPNSDGWAIWVVLP